MSEEDKKKFKQELMRILNEYGLLKSDEFEITAKGNNGGIQYFKVASITTVK